MRCSILLLELSLKIRLSSPEHHQNGTPVEKWNVILCLFLSQICWFPLCPVLLLPPLTLCWVQQSSSHYQIPFPMKHLFHLSLYKRHVEWVCDEYFQFNCTWNQTGQQKRKHLDRFFPYMVIKHPPKSTAIWEIAFNGNSNHRNWSGAINCANNFTFLILQLLPYVLTFQISILHCITQ